ncbi:hypothetical protein [Candidatus Nitronereus thalassa]|uniref:Uncharacterized protein n=1 Tax=Candidatus Nitronereus thalassa TaxID=3020898 RepID=A0ABU3K4K9_9BACT|nr:hypothetical protein [Candidatus Nitronereus thalassa]MDT7041326.1 hypothetical protein [Candidatus Nitronereus thalassa]
MRALLNQVPSVVLESDDPVEQVLPRLFPSDFTQTLCQLGVCLKSGLSKKNTHDSLLTH